MTGVVGAQSGAVSHVKLRQEMEKRSGGELAIISEKLQVRGGCISNDLQPPYSPQCRLGALPYQLRLAFLPFLEGMELFPPPELCQCCPFLTLSQG